MLRTSLETILTLVYPQECRLCGDSVERLSDGVACCKCWVRGRIFDGSEVLCEKCGAVQGTSGGSGTVSCRECVDHEYDRAFAGGVYEHGLAATVLSLKSHQHLCSRGIGVFYSAFSHSGLDDVTFIVPIPLSRKRSHERGFNQAEVLAALIAKKFGIPLRKNILRRKEHTPMHRAAMDRKAREMTVKNAFEVNSESGLAGENILLVDDVLTSGSTASSCAGILKANGAGRVDVLTLARAV
ncbi:MAG: phosphoribosyltransferase family protein [Acidobacteriota bacterium]